VEADGRTELQVRKVLVPVKTMLADALDDKAIAVHPVAGLR
jgi:hypothetical protein